MSNSENNFSVNTGVVRFNKEAKSFSTRVPGRIINFAPSSKQRRAELRAWKKKVASAVQDERKGSTWDSKHLYAVTLLFRFHPRPTPLDVDNYVKPVLDGLAAGLFLDTDPRDLKTFAWYHGVDDSNFRSLLIRRLDDVETLEEEEVRLFVSTTGKAPPG